MRRITPGEIQAAYYGLTGIWPLVWYRSFEAVTGPKREPWLVKTVGLLVAVVAASLAADLDGRSPATRRLGIGSAVSLAAIDAWYAGVRRRISPIYLADAAVELGIVVLWARRDARPDS